MDNTYFKCRDDSYYTKYTKEEIFKMMDTDRETHLSNLKKLLKDMDYPFYKDIYNKCIQFNMENGFPKEKVIGRYIAHMRLKAYKAFGYNDGE